MPTVASVRVEKWGEEFVVVGEFLSHSTVTRQTFSSYEKALEEAARVIRREVLRNG